MSSPGVRAIRRRVVNELLFRPTTLAGAIAKMGFVQADPIRSPARAQDLILRHRVAGYRTGDLERLYPDLELEEDVLYAYGFMPSSVARLLHPRVREGDGGGTGLERGLERDILEFVRRAGAVHPGELLERFGARRERNAWGGHSRATTRVLESLHYRGYLRVARREGGVRVYELARWQTEPAGAGTVERMRRLTLLVARLFGPLPETSLRALVSKLRHAAPLLTGRTVAVSTLVAAGELERHVVDGIPYLAPSRSVEQEAGVREPVTARVSRTVRLLAPFDPVVWDRRRFEHLWGWPYRFEAYTPGAQRRFGYYALPMLWGDSVIGWANVGVSRSHPPTLMVETGFVAGRPKDRAFDRALEAELERMRRFLRAGSGDG